MSNEIQKGHQVYVRDYSLVVSRKKIPTATPWLVMDVGPAGAEIWCPQINELCWTPVDNLVRDRSGITMRVPEHIPPAGYRQHPGYTPGPGERIWWSIEAKALGGGPKENAGTGYQIYAAWSELTGLLGALGSIRIATRLTSADENGDPTGGTVWNGNSGGGSLHIRPMTWEEIEDKLDRDQAAAQRFQAMRDMVRKPSSKPAETAAKVGDHVIRDYDGRTGSINFVGRDAFQIWWNDEPAVDPLFYVHSSLLTPREGGPHKLITDTGVTVELAGRDD